VRVAPLVCAVVVLAGSPFDASASSSATPRLAVSWPGTGFVGYRLQIHGRATGWPQPVAVMLQRRNGHAWRAFGRAAPDSSGAFVVSSHHAGRVGPLQLRLVVGAGSAVLARRFATVRIRPLPIVIPADRVRYLPQEEYGIKPLLFSLAGASGCPRVAVGPTVYKDNFVAVGYNAQTAPHGFLGKISRVRCTGQTARIYSYPVSLGDAVQDGFLDLARFAQKAGASPASSAQKSMSATFDLTGCSPAAPSRVTASADFSVNPRLTMRFSSRQTPTDDYWAPPNLADAAFTATGSTTLSLTVDANAPAACDLGSFPSFNQYHDSPIATYQGWVGPIPVVVDLVGYAGIGASLTAPASVSEEFHAYDAFSGTAAYSAQPGSSAESASGFKVTATEPTVNGNADISARLQAGFQIGLYGVASFGSPSAGIAGFATTLNVSLHADTIASPWWTINADGGASAHLASLGGGSTPPPGPDVGFGSTIFALASDGPFPGPTGTVTFPNPGDQTGFVGIPVSLQLHANASDGGPVVFTVGPSDLPPGLQLDRMTGLITGTPTGSANYFSPTITATGATGPSETIRFKWPIRPAFSRRDQAAD